MDNFFEDEIESIEYIGVSATIDITTDGNHLFFANGILTHNSSHESSDYDHSHISGGISKINTADNVIGIFTSGAMKEAGRYQIQFMKTRSSSGVGSKIDLNFNNSSLKIYDLQEGDIDSTNATAQSIYDTLKKKSVVNDNKEPLSETTQMSSTSATANVLEKTTELRDFLKRR